MKQGVSGQTRCLLIHGTATFKKLPSYGQPPKHTCGEVNLLVLTLLATLLSILKPVYCTAYLLPTGLAKEAVSNNKNRKSFHLLLQQSLPESGQLSIAGKLSSEV